MPTKNSTYIVLGIVLLILTGIGGYFLFQVYQANNTQTTYTSQTTPKIELIPTDSPDEEVETITPSVTTASATTVTPIASVSGKVTPTTTKSITPTKTPTATPTTSSSNLTTYSSAQDNFSVEYSPTRKVYQDTETSLYDSDGELSTDSTGTRYTFYLSTGNFAVHVTSGDLWAWKNVNREFDSDSLIAGQASFRYDITSQTIVDFQSGDKNYTIQCVHNGVTSLKTECEAFISSFEFL